MQEIECNFVERERFETVFGQQGGNKKLGSYHGSYHHGVEGFGRTRWVICAELEGDFSKYSELTPEDLVEGCVTFLNRPVGKRKKKPLYGNLELYRFKIKDDDTITVLLSIDQKKSKYFWGKGKVHGRIRKRKKK